MNKEENKNVLIFFVEGETEIEFYTCILNYFHTKFGKFNTKIEIKNLKGITNYKTKVNRILEKDLIPKYKNNELKVFLCYDTDVFEYSQKPNINWKEIENSLKTKGIKHVIHIKANKSIEDWFLYDMKGIYNFLKLKSNINISKNTKGIDILKTLFKKANKTYIKGEKCKNFAKSLNIEKIIQNIPDNSNIDKIKKNLYS